MEKERRIKVLSLVALIVAVLGLTVAFASLSRTLTINGTASVNAAQWDIYFQSMGVIPSGSATVNDEGTITSTGIEGLSITLTKPDDVVQVDFRAYNKGTIDAKIASIEIPKLCTLSSPVERCDWDNDGTVTQSDVDKVNNNITIGLQYDGDDAYNPYGVPKVGDLLESNKRRDIDLTILYGYLDFETEEYVSSTELPARNLVFSDLSVNINYVQAD